MPLKLVAGPRPETTALRATLTLATNLQPDLRRPMLPPHSNIDRAPLPISTSVTADRLHRTSTQNSPRSNPHSVRRTLTRSNTAVSSLGGFRTPATTARGTITSRRHPKTFTIADIASDRHRRLDSHQARLPTHPRVGYRFCHSARAPHEQLSQRTDCAIRHCDDACSKMRCR